MAKVFSALLILVYIWSWIAFLLKKGPYRQLDKKGRKDVLILGVMSIVIIALIIYGVFVRDLYT